jgi:hypothetical protein
MNPPKKNANLYCTLAVSTQQSVFSQKFFTAKVAKNAKENWESGAEFLRHRQLAGEYSDRVVTFLGKSLRKDGWEKLSFPLLCDLLRPLL